jgi:alpha-D-ribose 1-methylphosphonate 5-triphosphate synthase subunit PhnH
VVLSPEVLACQVGDNSSPDVEILEANVYRRSNRGSEARLTGPGIYSGRVVNPQISCDQSF